MAIYSSFLCTSCHTEIQASPDMVGLETECPACGARIVIPSPDEDPATIEAMKSRTIRIELGDGEL